MQKRPQSSQEVRRILVGKVNKPLNHGLLAAFSLSACGEESTTVVEPIEPIIEPVVVSPNEILKPTLATGVDYISAGNNTELISTTYDILKTITLITDENINDADILDISTGQKVDTTPTIYGIEFINFNIEHKTPTEEATVNLGNIYNFNTITFSNKTAVANTEKISVLNASGTMKFDSGYTNINVSPRVNEDVHIEVSKNSVINVQDSASSLTINGGGKSVNVDTSNTGSVNISNTGDITLKAAKAKDSLQLVSNGNVTVSEASSLTGNISVTAIGAIQLQNVGSATGKLDLENLRAEAGSDITLSNVSSAKSVEIKSAGSVNAILNDGLKSAETIDLTVAENSNINASGTIPRAVSLSAINETNSEVVYNINIGGMSSLSLGGSAPILINSPGENLNSTAVTKKSPINVTINMTTAGSDVSNISSDIVVRLPNLDGNQIVVGNNQNLAIDAEVTQTDFSKKTEYKFATPATTSTSNTIKISTIDTSSSNSDTTADIAGLKLSEIQILNIDLSNSVSLKTSQNIVGTDLKTVLLTGSGDFDLDNNTIVGIPDGTVSLTSSNYTGNLTISVNNTEDGIKSITAGSGNDAIKIDGINSPLSSSGRGISIDTGAGHDTVSLTANSDGKDAKVLIKGGEGVDKASFAAAVDFSLSDLSLIAFEDLEFTGGSGSTKLPSNVVSGSNLSISENGTGTLLLEIFPITQTVNLSSLVFEDSIVAGTDKIIVNGSNFTSALTITGSTMDDEITGTYTSADTINSGDGNDTIKGLDGNDILNPGDGIDHITSGLGNDTINLSERVSAVDTLYYSIDDGAKNVDTVINFDVRLSDDIISLDVSETSTAITFGNGVGATAANKGTISIVEQAIDTDANYASISSATIIKLTSTDKSDFATALGRAELSVANNAVLPFLWFDKDTSQAVFGYSVENFDSPSDNKIVAADTFTEIARLNMTENSYTHFLGTDNFAFI